MKTNANQALKQPWKFMSEKLTQEMKFKMLEAILETLWDKGGMKSSGKSSGDFIGCPLSKIDHALRMGGAASSLFRIKHSNTSLSWDLLGSLHMFYYMKTILFKQLLMQCHFMFAFFFVESQFYTV